jgi:hypothetical protein
MSWHVEKLTGFIAARLTGLDLSKPHGPDTGTHLRRLLGEHQVLIIPGQRINLDHQKALTRLFGEPMSLPYVKPLEDDPEVIRVYKGADERDGDAGYEFGFPGEDLLRAVGAFCAEYLHAANAQEGQDEHCHQNNADAANPLQKRAPQQNARWFVVKVDENG